MAENVIELREALEWMEAGKPFQLTAVTYDRNRRTGGTFINFHHATMLSKQTKTGIIRLRTNSGQVREVHQRLITKFNHKHVTW